MNGTRLSETIGSRTVGCDASFATRRSTTFTTPVSAAMGTGSTAAEPTGSTAAASRAASAASFPSFVRATDRGPGTAAYIDSSNAATNAAG